MKEELNSGRNGFAFAGGFYSIGDKIMQTRNNYDLDLFNGDMGRVVSISKDADGIHLQSSTGER